MLRAERTHRRHARGFTLIEVAVSIAILGGVVAGLLVARSRSQQAHAAAKEMMTCTSLCASQVAALRAGLADAGRGEFAEAKGFTWNIVQSPDSGALPRGLREYTVSVAPPFKDDVAGVSAIVWLYFPY